MGLGTIGALTGNLLAGGDQQQSEDALKQALQNIASINTPTIEEQKLALQKEQSAGTLSPEQEQAVQQQTSGMGNIAVNPALRAAQMQALESLQQQSTQGLSPSDKLALTQIGQQDSQQANSQNQAVLQGLAARGMGGSGASLAAQLANNQNSANNQQNQSMQVGAQAAQNMLNATAQAGQLGSSLENNQYSEASNAARAQDAINQFNTANKQGVNAQNTLAANQGQAYNLQNQQNISNQNTNINNQQQQYNSQLYQQQYNDQMEKAKAAAGAENNLSGYYGNQAAGTRQEGAAIGSGIQQGITSVFSGGMGGAGGASGGQASMNGLASGGSGTGAPGTIGNLGPTQATQYGGANAGWAHGGEIPEPGYSNGGMISVAPQHVAPMHAIKIFRMLSPTGHNNMYADGGQVPQQLSHQQVMEAIQRGANAVSAPPPPQQYMSNGVGAEDAAQMGEDQTAQAHMAAQLAAFNAAHGRPQAGYSNGGAINFTSGGPVSGPEIVPGDSPKNDVVSAKLSGGELVIPKEINQTNDENIIMAFIKGAKTAGRR